MLIPDATVLFLAQARPETGDPSQTGWFSLVIALVLIAFLMAGFMVRRARRRNSEPPVGSVPARDMSSDR